MSDPKTHFDTLAEMTGHACPAAWVALMTAFPESLAARTYPGLECRVVDHELLADLAALVALNEDVRAEDVWGDEDEEDQPWVAERLAIGQDMSGDVVFLDTTRPNPPVQRFLVSSGRVIEMAPDIETFAAMLDTDDVKVPRI
jgi:hypothetical protein